MDPDACLTTLWLKVHDLYHGEPDRTEGILQLEQVAEHATALAEWLRKGGFTPRNFGA